VAKAGRLGACGRVRSIEEQPIGFDYRDPLPINFRQLLDVRKMSGCHAAEALALDDGVYKPASSA
jgi:hypothetical protein